MSNDVQMEEWPRGNVGYVGLIGRPNTGKSTFLNTVLGFHLAAVSRQPQTTRRHALGILSGPDSQILFIDAPGVHIPHDQLGEAMVGAIARTLEEADVILCIVDPTRAPGEEDDLVARRVADSGGAVILAINKIDACDEASVRRMRDVYRAVLGEVPVFTFSAYDRETLEPVLAAVRERLPQGPFLYAPEDITDEYQRDIAAELIRETCLDTLRQEVPHALAVTIEQWKEENRGTRVEATVHVERTSQKKIVVGRRGRMVKLITKEAEKRLAELCPDGISLRLWIKVSKDWRSRKHMLRELGLLADS